MDENKSFVGKAMFYGVVFFVSAVVFFVMSQFGTQATGTVAMSEATLPVVMMQTEDEKTYNRLYGYTSDVDETRMNLELTIVPSNLELGIVVDTYNESVESLSYKIRAKKDYSLIENTMVEDYQISDGQLKAVLEIKNLIRDDEEYYLEVVIKTDKHENISYYTVIMKDTGFKLSDKLNYVLNFNACTFDENRLSEIAGNLETSKTADNTNYGKVDITNTKAMVGWGDLKPFVESNIVPSVYMLDEEVAVVTLDYTIGVENSNGGYDTFMVHEFYRVRQTSLRFYLLNFDRQTTQVFDSRGDLISTGKINLGIAPDTQVEVMADKKNNYVYFVNSGTLWCFDKEKHVYYKVFAFESEDTDNVRERRNAHSIKVLSVAEDGSGYFLVYGYMNRGAHEGQVGVSLFKYDFITNEVSEELYIPTDVPVGVLCNNVAEIAHVTESNSLYIKIDDVLYLIDLESKETMTEIKGLVKGTYSISENQKIIAYHVDGGINGTDRIRVFNVETGKDTYIEAGTGKKAKGLGFVVNDFIYGIANQEDIIADSFGEVIFAMNKLYLINGEFEQIRSYEPEGAYVVKAIVEDYRINLERVAKNEDGRFVNISLDQLINREENVEADEVAVTTMKTDARKTEVVIELAGGFTGGVTASTKTALKIEYEDEEKFKLPDPITGGDKFYIRGYGSYITGYYDIEDAIMAANMQYGRIYDSEFNLVWKRFKVAQANLSGISSKGCSAEDSYGNARSILASFGASQNVVWLNMQGVSVEYLLSFVGEGSPVMGNTLAGYVIVTGYTSKEITYMEVTTGKSVTVDYNEAGKLFSQAGNTFVTYYRK